MVIFPPQDERRVQFSDIVLSLSTRFRQGDNSKPKFVVNHKAGKKMGGIGLPRVQGVDGIDAGSPAGGKHAGGKTGHGTDDQRSEDKI